MHSFALSLINIWYNKYLLSNCYILSAEDTGMDKMNKTFTLMEFIPSWRYRKTNKQRNTQSDETSNISNGFTVGTLEKDRVKNEHREFNLRNNIQTRRSSREKQVWWQADQEVNQELCFGHVQCEMPTKYPGREFQRKLDVYVWSSVYKLRLIIYI